MRCACIDIGTNTTRVLVADVGAHGLREVLQDKAYTRLGQGREPDGSITAPKLAELARVVGAQRAQAREAGASAVRVVATAAMRTGPNRAAVCAALAEPGAEGEVVVLEDGEEARLAFLGATRTLPEPLDGKLAVVDIGGGSTEIAIGTTAGGVTWWASRPVGSGTLRGSGSPSAPSAVAGESGASALPPGGPPLLRARAEAGLSHLELPRVEHAIAVGGSATSLRRVVGPVLDPRALERALRELCSAPPAHVAARFGLEEERVRLLPAGIVILDAVARRLRRPLRIGLGGLREGVLLDLGGVR